METITTFYELAKQLGLIDTFFAIYGKYIWTVCLITALLNCLFGYRLRKLWSVLFGFLAGAAAGIGLAVYLNQSGKLILAAALVLGIICALLAFLLYRVGLFILCAGLTTFLLWQLLPFHTGTAFVICMIIGAVLGALTLARERLVVSLTTAIGGAWGSAWAISLLTGQKNTILLFLITVSLAVLGILLQLKPWKDRSYWDPRDEKERQKLKEQRERRKQKKKAKHKKARQKRKEKQQKKQKEKPQPQQNRTPQAPPAQTGEKLPFSGQQENGRSVYPAPAPNDSPINSDTPEAPASSDISSDPLDFSDIKSQLSQEVSEIFQEQQQEQHPSDY